MHGDDDRPTMKSAKATLNSSVCKSPHLARNVGKDAVERGHDERRVEGWMGLRGREYGRRVQQLEFRRVIADRLRELGVLLFGQRLNLFLLVVPVLDVLHHRGGRRLIDLVVGAGQVAVQAGEDAMQLLHLGIRGGVLELLGRLRDLVLDGRAPLRRVVGDRDSNCSAVLIDGRKRFVLVGGPLDGLAAGRLEAGADAWRRCPMSL